MKTRTKRMLGLLLGLLLVLIAAGCDTGKQQLNEGAQAEGQQQTQTAFRQQSRAVPYPLEQLRDSTERRNLREKNLRFNDPNKIGYVYLFSQTGSVISFWTIKGKVSSAQSQMTATELIECPNVRGEPNPCVTVTGPGDDGSYGENERAIFFFTTEGVYVSLPEHALWVYLDSPLELETAPTVVLSENAKPTSVSGDKLGVGGSK